MKIIDHPQGSPEWKAHRKTTHSASDYPVAQGFKKGNKTRSALIREFATGIEVEFTEFVEKILANGHRVEEMAKPMAELIIGEDLFPIVATTDDGYLGASSDGATAIGDKGWECKQWNAALAESVANGIVPDTHVGQLDQQGEVFGFETILFMVTDGTPENCVYCWYSPSAEAKAAIRPTWRQLDEDAANYQPEVIEQKPILVANPIDNLPALVIEVTGRVTHSNLVEFKAAATAVISSIKTDLVTDQDFVDAGNAVKYLKDVEDSARRAKQNALDQTTSIAELHRALDEVTAMAAAVRKSLDKKITEEKDKRKEEIVLKARSELFDHFSKLNDRIGGFMPAISCDFAASIKGLKSLDSMKDKASSALANAKIEASATADRIEANIKSLDIPAGNSENGGLVYKDWRFLFPDLPAVCKKAPDDFAALLSSRISAHKEAESKRLEAERENIRADEQAKAEAKARREAQEAAAKAEAERLAALLKPAPEPDCVQETTKIETQATLTVTAETQPETPVQRIQKKEELRAEVVEAGILKALEQMNIFQRQDVLAYCEAILAKARMGIAA